jgi:hypothetical protein
MIYIATDNIVFRDTRPMIPRGSVVLSGDFPGAAKCRALASLTLDDSISLEVVPGWARRASRFEEYDVEKFLLASNEELSSIGGVKLETIDKYKAQLKKYLEGLFAQHC